MFKRYKLTNAFFQDALSLSNEKGKKLLVIGDPCGGTYFQFITKYFLDYGHGDVTIDLFGCEKCTRMDINDMEAWSTFEADSFVVMETGTLSFSKDIRKFWLKSREFLAENFFQLEVLMVFCGKISLIKLTIKI